VRVIAAKKDILWVRWVHRRYLGRRDWWEYTPTHNSYWYWRKICYMKEEVKWGSSINYKWEWNGKSSGLYNVNSGYRWLLNLKEKMPWAKLVWSKANIPRQAFVNWLLISDKLHVKARLIKFGINITPNCAVCNADREDIDHLFYCCTYAQEVWKGAGQWL